MSNITGTALESLPAIVFQFTSGRLELVNRELSALPGLTQAKLTRLLRGEWEKIVPEEFHPVVRKLGAVLQNESHTTVEFPAYWMGTTIWLRIFAAAARETLRENANEPVRETVRKRTMIGLVQDVTAQRHFGEGECSPDDEEHWKRLRHDISSAVTSILMNCELLLGADCEPGARQRIDAILSEALRISRLLRGFTA